MFFSDQKSSEPKKGWPLSNEPVDVFGGHGNTAEASSSGRAGRLGDATTSSQERSATVPVPRIPEEEKPHVFKKKQSFGQLVRKKSRDALAALRKRQQ